MIGGALKIKLDVRGTAVSRLLTAISISVKTIFAAQPP